MRQRRGLGKGLGTGYKNLALMDSHIHSLSAKGFSQKQSNYMDYMIGKSRAVKKGLMTEEQAKKDIKKYKKVYDINAKGKKTPNLYLQLNKKIETEIDEFPMFFAFNKEQLDDGLKKLKTTMKDIYKIGGGGFIRKVDSDRFGEMLERHNKEHKDMMKNKEYVYQMFRYELANHEYCITYDYEDTLSSLNLTMSEVKKNPMLKEQLIKAKNDYLKNAGDC